jgi:hypothetical protein
MLKTFLSATANMRWAMLRRGVSLLAVMMLSLVAAIIPLLIVRESTVFGSPDLPDVASTLESLHLSNTSDKIFEWEVVDLRQASTAASDPSFASLSKMGARLSMAQDVAADKVPVVGVSITGDRYGGIGVELTFTAIVTPLDASPPVRYTWSPSPVDGQRRQSATYIWTSPGWKVINVIASNKTGSAPASHEIFISGSTIPVREVDIADPGTVYLNETDSLTATFSPADATRPIDFLWLPNPDSGQHTPHATYTWRNLGVIAVTVVASNTVSSPAVSHTHYLIVTSIPIDSVWISGTSAVTANLPALFTAPTSPTRATRPITYTWLPEPHSGQFSPTATYVFTKPGDVAITVTAENIRGFRQSPPYNAHVTDGVQRNSIVYLPVTLRRWPPVPDAPQMPPIENDGGDHDYVVSWNSVYLADMYILEEDTNGNFSDPMEIYSGTATTYPVTGNGPSRYYYRVRARNGWGDGGWSTVRSVDVLWELEPDEWIYQANGPLVSGVTYYGYPDEYYGESSVPWDCLYINTASTGWISVQLRNHRGKDPQLLLYYQSYSGFIDPAAHGPDAYKEHYGVAGQYFVCTYSVGGGTEIPYTLRVTFP